MKFLSLAFHDFMSFRNQQTLPLADLGLVLVNGDNRLSSAADSNGVGKTAIFDALSWVLFGQTLRGLKADDVACRFTKDQAQVALTFELEGRKWAIERTRRPATLDLYRIDGEKKHPTSREDVQEQITQLLGFGYRTFRNAVVFGQGIFERFASASQADQMKMLDEIQHLDLTKGRARAGEWRDKARRRLQELEENLVSAAQRGRGIEEQIRLLEDAQEKFADAKEDAVQQAEKQLALAEEVLLKTATEFNSLSERFQKVQQVKVDVKILEDETRAYEEYSAKIKEAQMNKTNAEEKKVSAQVMVQTLVKGGRCSRCRVKLVGDARREMEQGFQPEAKQADITIAAADRTLEQLRREQEKAKEKLQQASDDFLKKHNLPSISSLDRIERECSPEVIDRAGRLHEQARQRVEELKEMIARERKRQWDGDAPLKAARRDIQIVTEKIETQTKERGKVQEAVAIAEYWVEAFGDRGIRSLMFDSVSGFLNRRLHEHLEILTGGESTVEFSALSTLKSGSKKEKLSIGASWAWGAGTYLAGSAGQDRRIDLAIFGAMQDLAERRSARPFPLRIWDEAGDSLDARGKELFADWVRQEARKRGSGFVITHDRDFSEIIEPDQLWTVVLNKEGGSEVIQS